MARNSSLVQCANYLIILSACIDQGDGRWKERDKENLRHDIMAYKKMAEKLEHEIEAFYEEYQDERLSGENIDRIYYKYLTNLLNRNTETTKGSENKESEKYNFSFVAGATVDKGNSKEKPNKPNVLNQRSTISESNIQSNKNSAWPKFEDILLAVGRKYDWKNDRWIKVKFKPNKLRNSNLIETSDKEKFHEKHKFSYKLVKLNRSKTRRNVVVAVSAGSKQINLDHVSKRTVISEHDTGIFSRKKIIIKRPPKSNFKQSRSK